MNYSSSSPYANTPQNSWFIGLYKHRAILPDKGDRVVKITSKYNLRPDLLSYDLYGTPVYWWVFLVRNMNVIRDPIWDFQEGKSIFVPSADYVSSVIG